MVITAFELFALCYIGFAALYLYETMSDYGIYSFFVGMEIAALLAMCVAFLLMLPRRILELWKDPMENENDA